MLQACVSKHSINTPHTHTHLYVWHTHILFFSCFLLNTKQSGQSLLQQLFPLGTQLEKILPLPKSHLFSLPPSAGAQWTWAETTQEDQQELILPLYWTTPLTIIPFASPEVNPTHSCYWGGIRLHVEGWQPDVTLGQEVVGAFWKRWRGRWRTWGGCWQKRNDSWMWLEMRTLRDAFLKLKYWTYSAVDAQAQSSWFLQSVKMNMENYAWKHGVSLIFHKVPWRVFEAEDVAEGLNIKRKFNSYFLLRLEGCHRLSRP